MTLLSIGERVVTPENNYPLQPRHINTQELFWGGFGNMEKEGVARYIVMFCQERGGWISFTLDEIRNFFEQLYDNSSRFIRLLDQLVTDRYLVNNEGQYYLTHGFISACFKASPAIWE